MSAETAMQEMLGAAKSESVKRECIEIVNAFHDAMAGHSLPAIIVSVASLITTSPGLIGTAIKASLGVDGRTEPDFAAANEAMKSFLDKKS